MLAHMKEAASNLGMKALALAVLLVAAWILFKFVLGVLDRRSRGSRSCIGAVIAAIWALGRLFWTRSPAARRPYLDWRRHVYGGAYLAIMIFFGLSAGGDREDQGLVVLPLVPDRLLPAGHRDDRGALYRWDRYEPRRRCEECGTVVAVHDQVCKRCGRDLEWPEEILLPKPARRAEQAPATGRGSPYASQRNSTKCHSGSTSRTLIGARSGCQMQSAVVVAVGVGDGRVGDVRELVRRAGRRTGSTSCGRCRGRSAASPARPSGPGAPRIAAELAAAELLHLGGRVGVDLLRADSGDQGRAGGGAPAPAERVAQPGRRASGRRPAPRGERPRIHCRSSACRPTSAARGRPGWGTSRGRAVMLRSIPPHPGVRLRLDGP